MEGWRVVVDWGCEDGMDGLTGDGGWVSWVAAGGLMGRGWLLSRDGRWVGGYGGAC